MAREETKAPHQPEILAPAGNSESFLAALGAGADSIYCGLKHFSARMEAENLSISELASLAELARDKGSRTYVALNALVKPGELDAAGGLLRRLADRVRPEGLIIQDPAFFDLAEQTGFRGEIHLSTLAHICLGKSLPFLRRKWGVKRIVLPRELDLDEIKALAGQCPPDLDLEVFVHGALCYAVSGRCYWSSLLGGKSGLRGRCVQPCRRLYEFKNTRKRYFSCLDLALGVLTKTLLDIPQVKAWKIEGRKKGPHYVFYTVRAYRLLRDHPEDPQAKKDAQDLLQRSLGRKTTTFFFLPQSPHPPMDPNQENVSGMFAGKLGREGKKPFFLRPRFDLLPGDVLRAGIQDLPGHFTYKASKYAPKGKKLSLGAGQTGSTPGMPIFLIDRREPELKNMLRGLDRERPPAGGKSNPAPDFRAKLPQPGSPPHKTRELHVHPAPPQGGTRGELGLWLDPRLLRRMSKTLLPKCWLWLPPVIWPGEEESWADLLEHTVRSGGRRFVLNGLSQIALLPQRHRLELWAGPFMNLANPLALARMRDLGFGGAIVSPELSRKDFLSLPRQSPLHLGLVLAGPFPYCISRALAPELQPGLPLASPKKEISWIATSGGTVYHYPQRELDLSPYREELKEAGYSLFVHFHRQFPKKVPRIDRRSAFNWNLKLL